MGQIECIENTRDFSHRHLGGGTAPLSPFQRLPKRLAASPSRRLYSLLRPKGHIPLEPPKD